MSQFFTNKFSFICLIHICVALLRRSNSYCYEVGCVYISVSPELSFELAHYFFLIFCMLLGAMSNKNDQKWSKTIFQDVLEKSCDQLCLEMVQHEGNDDPLAFCENYMPGNIWFSSYGQKCSWLMRFHIILKLSMFH